MFEQELYKQQISEMRSQDGDLFHNYEIKSWKLSPRIYKIITVSAIFNIAILLVFGQANLLTLRGCDSPFVGRVCQVLDTVYVGSVLFGTEREYVDAVYEKIDLEDADITYIDVSGETPPLSYPEGYFQIANPVQFAMLQQRAANPASGFTSTPGFTPNPSVTNDFLNTTPVTPRENPNALKGEDPTSPFTITGDEPKKGKRGDRNSSPANTNAIDADDQVADADKKPDEEPLSTDPVTAVEINRKPMTDFADSVLVKWTANEIDLDQQFTVVLDGVLTKDGKLDPRKSKWDTKKEAGDPKMIEIAKQSVEALSQSGWLGYLRNLGVEKINFKLVQDDTQIVAVITSSQKTVEKARMISSGMNGILQGAALTMKNPSDERTLLSGARVTSDGANFILDFSIPKPIAQEMIDRKLKEAQAKKQQQPQPNGTALTKPSDNTAKK